MNFYLHCIKRFVNIIIDLFLRLKELTKEIEIIGIKDAKTFAKLYAKK